MFCIVLFCFVLYRTSSSWHARVNPRLPRGSCFVSDRAADTGKAPGGPAGGGKAGRRGELGRGSQPHEADRPGPPRADDRASAGA